MPNQRKKANKVYVAFALALMFGIGWIFGILGSEDRNILSIIFQFLFIIFVGFQGFFIFLLHPCRSKEAHDLWKKWFYCVTCRKHIYDEMVKASIKKMQELPSQNHSSAVLSNSTSTTTSSVGYAHPSTSDIATTTFSNPGVLPVQASTPGGHIGTSNLPLGSIEEVPTEKENMPSPLSPLMSNSTFPLKNGQPLEHSVTVGSQSPSPISVNFDGIFINEHAT